MYRRFLLDGRYSGAGKHSSLRQSQLPAVRELDGDSCWQLKPRRWLRLLLGLGLLHRNLDVKEEWPLVVRNQSSSATS